MQIERLIRAAERRQKVREDLEAEGSTIAQWADRHGYDRALVYAVLSGRISGKWGTAHHIAVALGLKGPPRNEKAAFINRDNDEKGVCP